MGGIPKSITLSPSPSSEQLRVTQSESTENQNERTTKRNGDIPISGAPLLASTIITASSDPSWMLYGHSKLPLVEFCAFKARRSFRAMCHYLSGLAIAEDPRLINLDSTGTSH